MSSMNTASGVLRRAWMMRATGFLIFWVVMAGLEPADLAVGVIAALIATAVSLQLLPARDTRMAPLAMARLIARFLRQSLVAGFDVAWRALDPRLPLRPGFILYRSRLPAGPMRDAFCTMTSLLPGTLPAGAAPDGALLVHCLDVDAPVAEQLAREEQRFTQAFGVNL
jgi:multicomponent Na+:H+ antiporter subunit E